MVSSRLAVASDPASTGHSVSVRLGLADPSDIGLRSYQGVLDTLDHDDRLLQWILARWDARRRILEFAHTDVTSLCLVPGCGRRGAWGGLCEAHLDEHDAADCDLDAAVWAAQQPVLPPKLLRAGRTADPLPACAIEKDGVRCARPAHTRTSELCHVHGAIWRDSRSSGRSWDDFLESTRAFPRPPDCEVASCGWIAKKSPHRRAAPAPALCEFHHRRWRYHKTKTGEYQNRESFLASEAPADLLASQVWLGAVHDNVAAEALYALAHHGVANILVGMADSRRLVQEARDLKLISFAEIAASVPTADRRYPNAWQRTHAVWLKLLDRMGADPEREWERDVIRARVIDPNVNHDHVFEVGKISQSWLRDVFVGTMRRDWHAYSARSIQGWMRATIRLSESLCTRSDAGNDPRVLNERDIMRYRDHTIARSPSEKTARQYLSEARAFLTRAEKHGLTTQLRASFAIRASHMPVANEKVVIAGERALPDATFSLLCGLDSMLGRRTLDLLRSVPSDNRSHAGLIGEVMVMGLRFAANWGRRPGELLALPAERVRFGENGTAQLRYDNFKSGRTSVWLPIDAQQAQEAAAWTQELVRRFPNTSLTALKLFPRARRNPDGTKFVDVWAFSSYFRRWTAALEQAIVVAKLSHATQRSVETLLALPVDCIEGRGVRVEGHVIALADDVLAGLIDFRNDGYRPRPDCPSLFADPWAVRGQDAPTPKARFAALGEGWLELAAQYPVWGIPGEHLGRQRILVRSIEARRFRHTYLQHLVDAGVDIFLVQELADHVDIGTTIGAYVRTRIDQLTEAVERLSRHRWRRFATAVDGEMVALPSSIDVGTNDCENPQVHSYERRGCDQGELCYRCAYLIVDPSHEDDIETKVFTLRRSIQRFEDLGETQRAQIAREDLEGWKHVLAAMRSQLAALPAAERAQVREAVRIVRAYRMHRRSGNIPLGTTILVETAGDE